jgi:hypothetical protein
MAEVYRVGQALNDGIGGLKVRRPLESVPILIAALIFFTAVFAAFLFFNDDSVRKLMVCGATGIIVLLTALQLVKVSTGKR